MTAGEVHPFDPGGAGELPGTLPIFPLSGALLLPGGRLPLNVFEPRYLRMVEAALAGNRMIGMVQPLAVEEPEAAAFAAQLGHEAPGGEDAGNGPVFRVGCVGRIVAFSETDDGRFLITLRGVARFDVGEELAMRDGYRRVRPVFRGYEADLERQAPSLDRERLLTALTAYFERQGIDADWDTIKTAPDAHLVTSLAMVCPFSVTEKQALLEEPDSTARARAMTSMLEMAILGGESAPGSSRRQ